MPAVTGMCTILNWKRFCRHEQQSADGRIVKYGSITSLEAIEMYSATRLSSIIYTLRHNGYNIITEKIPFVDKFGTKTYYGRYFLKESN